MIQYIDKAAVVAEIENRIKETESMQPKFDQFWAGQISAFKGVLKILDTLDVKEVDLEKAIDKWICDDAITHDDCSITDVISTAKHFFELGLKEREECIKNIPLHGWQTPCADPNYPCENPQMDCINCPRFGHPQGTITMTSMKEKESEQGLVGK